MAQSPRVMSEDHRAVSSHHGGCEHGYDDSKLPRTLLVTLSGILTGIGLLVQWLEFAPPVVAVICYALGTLAGGPLVFPAAWNACGPAAWT